MLGINVNMLRKRGDKREVCEYVGLGKCHRRRASGTIQYLLSVAILGRSTLQSLVLFCCTRVSDRGLRSLSQGCPMIQNLNLRGCTLVTDAGVALFNDCDVTR